MQTKKKKGAAGPHKQETKMYKTAKRAEREEKVCGPLFLPKITAVFFFLFFLFLPTINKKGTRSGSVALSLQLFNCVYHVAQTVFAEYALISAHIHTH